VGIPVRIGPQRPLYVNGLVFVRKYKNQRPAPQEVWHKKIPPPSKTIRSCIGFFYRQWWRHHKHENSKVIIINSHTRVKPVWIQNTLYTIQNMVYEVFRIKTGLINPCELTYNQITHLIQSLCNLYVVLTHSIKCPLHRSCAVFTLSACLYLDLSWNILLTASLLHLRTVYDEGTDDSFLGKGSILNSLSVWK
jgi:hypothetical protein